MVKLDNIILPKQVSWVDRYTHVNVSNVYKETLGHKTHIYSQSFTAQRLITLEFEINKIGNELTHQIYEQIIEKANIAGLQMTFEYFTEIYDVVFFHGNERYAESQAIALKPYVFDYLPPNHTQNFYVGTIKLATVS